MHGFGVEEGLMSISRSNCFNSFMAVSFELERFSDVVFHQCIPKHSMIQYHYCYLV